jgi:hypothetical protein
MEKRLLLLGFSFLLLACAPTQLQYIPVEYKINKERIPNFEVYGEVVVENQQSDDSKRLLVKNDRFEVEGNYKLVSEALVKHLEKEIKVHGVVKQADVKKNIGVKVTLIDGYMGGLFHASSSMNVEVLLGNGKKINIVVRNSHMAIQASMNKSIAYAVIDIFENHDVLKYLAE